MVVFMLLASLDITRFPLGMMRQRRGFCLLGTLIMLAWSDMINSGKPRFWYNLVFSQGTRETITLHAPLFDISLGRYTIMPADIYAYWALVPPQVVEPELAPGPEAAAEHVYQQDPVYRWNLDEPQHYPGEGYFDPWP